jgi:hypothetical protein
VSALSSPAVASAPAGWQRFTRPGFRVEFSYPAVTPQGHAAERVEEQAVDHRGDIERVHITSRGGGELYVEVVRFRDLAPQDEYLEHRPYLERRFGPDAVTELTETSLLGRTACAYGFRWDEGERSVLSLQVASDTYRVIYDPRSELNDEVLATFTVRE